MKVSVFTSDGGFATLLALIMVGMLTLLGLAALSTSDDEITIASNELQEMRAFYAAEAGLERAGSRLQFTYDSTGRPPLVMPQGIDSVNDCSVVYQTADKGPATVRTLTTGTLSGLHALVKSFSINSTGISSVETAKVTLSQSFETALVPIFQFAVFYDNDLEINPGPDMNLTGRVHTNSDLYLQAGTSLRMDSYVTSAGDIHHGRKGPGGTSEGDVLIKDRVGLYVSMKDAGGWLESTDSYWYDSSLHRWHGRVQDATHGQQALSVPLSGSGDDPHGLIERATATEKAAGKSDSYEMKSTLKIIDRQAYKKVGGIWTEVTADMVVRGIISFENNKFVDQREAGVGVDVMELDVEKLYNEGYAPENGVLYFSDETTDFPALRIINGEKLDAPLSIASENPVYTLGDFNSSDKEPAAIMADAVTFLSGAWSDDKSDSTYTSRPAATTTVNASILTGIVETTEADYSGGFENLPRFLENWAGVDFNWSGSMVNLWTSVWANNPWGDFYYSPPDRRWAYDTDLNDPNKLPPETPVVRVFQRTGWKQEYVGIYE